MLNTKNAFSRQWRCWKVNCKRVNSVVRANIVVNGFLRSEITPALDGLREDASNEDDIDDDEFNEDDYERIMRTISTARPVPTCCRQ